MNRREFLKSGAAAGAMAGAAALSLPAFGAYVSGADKPLRVGLIGTGWYGKTDLFRLIQAAPVEVVSLCDVDKKMVAEAAEIVASRQKSGKKPRTYTDFRTDPDTTRPYTAAENAQADAAVEQAAAAEEHAETEDRVKAIVEDLKAEKARVQPAIDATNAAVNSSPASYVKDNARAIKRVADAAIDLAKYVDGK